MFGLFKRKIKPLETITIADFQRRIATDRELLTATAAHCIHARRDASGAVVLDVYFYHWEASEAQRREIAAGIEPVDLAKLDDEGKL